MPSFNQRTVPTLGETQEASNLKRRARRRLVGAFALLLLIYITLPLVLDTEPQPFKQDLSVQIPSQDSGRFAVPAAPSGSPAAPVGSAPVGAAPVGAGPGTGQTRAEAPAPTAPPAGPAPDVTAKPPVEASKKSAVIVPKKAAQSPDTAKAAETDEARRARAMLEDQSYIVPLGAYTNPANARQLVAKVRAAGVSAYTELLQTPRGEQTRVRAGPFATREQAEAAREKLKGLGVTIGPVASR